jgi:hypothetical protein
VFEGLDENSPSVIGLRVSLTPIAGFTFTVGSILRSKIDFQSGQFDAVQIPERLAGRLAPSVLLTRPVFTETGRSSPASRARPDVQLCPQPSNSVFPARDEVLGARSRLWPLERSVWETP